MKLNKTDYMTILNYYNLPIPKHSSTLKNKAEQILSEKLCRCIKKVGNAIKSEPKAIGVCTRNIFKRKGLKRGKFTCRKKNGQKNGQKKNSQKNSQTIQISK
jgi:hypothetical protein